jgi:hypothetical protein
MGLKSTLTTGLTDSFNRVGGVGGIVSSAVGSYGGSYVGTLVFNEVDRRNLVSPKYAQYLRYISLTLSSFLGATLARFVFSSLTSDSSPTTNGCKSSGYGSSGYGSSGYGSSNY